MYTVGSKLSIKIKLATFLSRAINALKQEEVNEEEEKARDNIDAIKWGIEKSAEQVDEKTIK